MLLLYLRIEHRDATVPVELPLDATVANLKTAAHDAGGPPAAQQVLTVGAEQLSCSGDTPLSDTLVSSEAVVEVRRRRLQQKTVSLGQHHCLALLEDGSVVGRGFQVFFDPIPEFDGRVSSVHAGREVSAAVVDGRLKVWGPRSRSYAEGLRRLEETEVVSCSAAACSDLIAVVDGGGSVHVIGHTTIEWTGMSAAAVSCGMFHVAVLTRDGAVAVRLSRSWATHALDLGGKTAVSVTACFKSTAVLLDDGTVRCFKEYGEQWMTAAELQPPPGLAGVVSCCLFDSAALACCDDGRLVSWGRDVEFECGGSACVAVECGPICVAAITADGRVVMGAVKGLSSWSRPGDLWDRRVALP